MSDLEKRIQHLEDLEAIRRLKHYYYCHCVDRAVGLLRGAMKRNISGKMAFGNGRRSPLYWTYKIRSQKTVTARNR